MRITLVTFGSEGDTRPFVALARGLINAGHEVLLFGEQSSLQIVRSCGVPTQALTGDVRAAMPVIGPTQDLTLKQVLKTVRSIRDMVNANTVSWMKSVSDHARTADAVMFAGLAYYQGEAVAQALQKPGIGLWLQPAAPTREFSSWALPPMRLPGWANRLSHGLSLSSALRRTFGRGTSAAREELFEQGAREYKSESLTLYGISRHLIKPPADWSQMDQICGHWALASEGLEVAAGLLEYLSAGPPPFYVGLGTASSFTGHTMLTKIVSAVGGRRALFYPGWSTIDSTMLPRNFFVVDHVPHAWLFPRVSMVMHHCGAGTTHTAARAGVPSVPLPLGGDQTHWANRLASAGVAAKYISRKQLDVRALQKMIAFAERDEVRERARTLGAAMSREDGVGFAITQIEEHLGVTRPDGSRHARS
jgi:UDP:flavonoid glycosyltransferase YjiC (YdhE family)